MALPTSHSVVQPSSSFVVAVLNDQRQKQKCKSNERRFFFPYVFDFVVDAVGGLSLAPTRKWSLRFLINIRDVTTCLFELCIATGWNDGACSSVPHKSDSVGGNGTCVRSGVKGGHGGGNGISDELLLWFTQLISSSQLPKFAPFLHRNTLLSYSVVT